MILFHEQVNLKKNQLDCNIQCSNILLDVEEYLIASKEEDDFVLAVINLKDYANFDDFLLKGIGNKRRAEYRKALRDGYYVKILTAEERNNRRDELYAINTSTNERQGIMSEEYSQYPQNIDSFTCSHHFQKTYAVFASDNTWIGYIYPRFCGEMVRTYRILGHANYMVKSNFMVLLLFSMVKDIMENHTAAKYLMYHLMHVGSQGLQDWKKNAGFKPVRFVGNIV